MGVEGFSFIVKEEELLLYIGRYLIKKSTLVFFIPNIINFASK
jgi:hypothetical protein